MNEQSITLVAIHGNGGGGFRFARTEAFMPDWIDFRPITLPGFANRPRDPQLTTLSDYADQLHAEIGRISTPLILLGTGIGGSIALDYAQRHADGLAGIILHAPVGTRLDTRWFPRMMRLPAMTQLIQWAISSRMFRPIFTRLFFHHPIPKPYLNQFFHEYGQCSVFGQMFDIITPDWWASLQPIAVPTALLWGEKERVLTLDQLDDYKQLLPNHLVKTVADWDHFPMVEQPQAFVAVVVELISALKAARSQTQHET